MEEKKEAQVIFTFEDVSLSIQCSKDNKMKDICQKYATNIQKNLNSFIFLYGGNQVNFQLTFNEQATSFDRNNNEMKILVYESGNGIIICPKCGEIMKFNNEMFDEIMLSNDKIKDTINKINLQIENIIKTSSMSSMNNQLKNINKMLLIINEDIDQNNKKLKNLINNNNTINNNVINNFNNNIYKTQKLDNNSNKEENRKNLINSNIKEGKNKNLYNKILFPNIKSIKVLKKVFYNLNEKIKLKAIKYNKYLQKKTDVNLIHYKFLSGKYLIYEEKGKGKEYNGYNNDLIFEGDYLQRI